jgi:hypothetical protein
MDLSKLQILTFHLLLLKEPVLPVIWMKELTISVKNILTASL